MANSCVGCEQNCCQDFKVGAELVQPNKFRLELQNYPYIHRTDSDLTFHQGRERLVGVYNCDRFNPQSGTCQDYHTRPRPPFCRDTGITGRPHSRCRLKPPASAASHLTGSASKKTSTVNSLLDSSL